MNICICDDEKEIIDNLQKILLKVSAKYNERILIDGYSESCKLIDALRDGEKYDIIFLDIQMPYMNGIEIGNFIRNKMDDNITQIVYISGESKYAMELFNIRPLNFILKPLEIDQIENIFLMGSRLIFNNKNLFDYKIRDVIHRIEYSKICYFSSEARKIEMVTSEFKVGFYEKMEPLYERVKNYNFLCIHKSYIVNNAHIVKFKSNSVVMDNGDELPISRSKRDEIRAIWI